MVPPVAVELDLRLFSFAILLLSQCGDAGPSTVVGYMLEPDGSPYQYQINTKRRKGPQGLGQRLCVISPSVDHHVGHQYHVGPQRRERPYQDRKQDCCVTLEHPPSHGMDTGCPGAGRGRRGICPGAGVLLERTQDLGTRGLGHSRTSETTPGAPSPSCRSTSRSPPADPRL